jgi:hypothetical protein
MRSELFAKEHLEIESTQPGLRLQNSKLLKAELNGECMARTGTMVAYQGNVQFQALGSGGMGKWLKQRLTGEGVPLMRVAGQGDVFFADQAADVHLDKGDAGFGISRIHLRTLGVVPGISEDEFRRHADAAKAGCPVSRALAAIEITLEASLG